MTIGRPPLKALVKGGLPATEGEIRKKTGLGRTTVWRWLKVMHEAGEIRIVGWNRVPNGGPFVPTYANGGGKDAPCMLKRFTLAQLSAQFRRRAKASGLWEDYKARNRRKYWADRAHRATYQRDPLMSWIPVRPANSQNKDAP